MLILIAHGSRDPLWRGALATLSQAVAEGLSGIEVRLAFMQFDGPGLSEVVTEAVADGHAHLRLLPLFMAGPGHVDKDIRPLLEELAQTHTGATLELLTPVGEDALFPELLIEIAKRPSTLG